MAIIASVATLVFAFFVLTFKHDLFYACAIKKAAEYYLACIAEASFFGFMFVYVSRDLY